MDLIANDLFIDSLENNGHCAGMASDELDEILTLPEGKPRGHYLVTFDPLDGSSNMDINMDVGAIFSVLKAPKGKQKPNRRRLRQTWHRTSFSWLLFIRPVVHDGINHR